MSRQCEWVYIGLTKWKNICEAISWNTIDYLPSKSVIGRYATNLKTSKKKSDPFHLVEIYSAKKR